jgi:putative aldouronate transport system substrate-binding protein
VLYNDINRCVVNVAELPEFLEYAKMARAWVEKRYMYAEGGKLPLEETIAMFAAGKFAGSWDYWDPGEVGMSKPYFARRKTDGRWTHVQWQTQARAAASMTCICATFKYPEIALQIINLANSDPEFYNLISYGIEGRHWVWVDKELKLIGYPEGIDETTVGYSNQWWAMGSIFNGYYWDRGMAETDSHQLTKQAHDAAPPSVILGFILDTAPVEAQVAQCRAAWSEFATPLQFGQVADVEAGVAELRKQLKACGIDDVIAEMQRQIDKWAASQ